MKFFAIAAALSMSACAAPKPVVPDVPVIAPKTSIQIPPGLIAPCDSLTSLDDTKTYTQGDITDVISVWEDEHADCARRFKKFVDLTSPVLNINEAPLPASDSTAN